MHPKLGNTDKLTFYERKLAQNKAQQAHGDVDFTIRLTCLFEVQR